MLRPLNRLLEDGRLLNGHQVVMALGLIWLGLGLLVVTACGLVALISLVVPVPQPPVRFYSAGTDFIWHHLTAVAACEAMFGMLLVYLAVMFMRARRWAWYALQGIAGLLAVLILIGTIVFAPKAGLYYPISSPTAPPFDSFYRMARIFVSAFWTGAFALNGVLLRLRSISAVFDDANR